MKASEWPDGSNPVYVDPTWEGLKSLAKNAGDSFRVVSYYELYDGGPSIAIADGFGNTHQSIQLVYRKLKGLRRAHGWDYILYKETTGWYFNISHVAELRKDEKIPFESGLKYFDKFEVLMFKDLMALIEGKSRQKDEV